MADLDLSDKTTVRFSLPAKAVFSSLIAFAAMGFAWNADRTLKIEDAIEMGNNNEAELARRRLWMADRERVEVQTLSALRAISENQENIYCDIKMRHGEKCEFELRSTPQ